MKEIIEKYLQWKEGREEDYVYDEIHGFFSSLDRGELVDIMEEVATIFLNKNARHRHAGPEKSNEQLTSL